MNTPLEDRVHDALHRAADPLHRAPLTVTDVRQRARRIQRRRAVAAGAAVAAALAVAVPVGLTMTGPAQRSEIAPATRTSQPDPAITGTVLVDPRSAEVVDSTPVPLVDVDAPSVITSDGVTRLPRPYSTITPYLDGWVGVAMDEGRGTLEFLTSDLEVEDAGGPTGGLVVRPDGQRIAWSQYTGESWQVVVADPDGGSEWAYTTFPPAPQEHFVVPVGFVSDDEVVVRQYDNTGDVATYAAGGDRPVELPGLVQAEGASAAAGLVAGLTRSTVDGSCSAVMDGLARTGAPLWETCEHRLSTFSPSGQYVVGTVTSGGEYGSPTLAILDARSGAQVVDFEVAASRRQVVGIWSQMAWEGDDAVVVRVMSGEDYFMVRLGVDGTVRRIGIESAGATGLSVAEVG